MSTVIVIVCSTIHVLEEFSKTFEAVIDAANSISFDLWCPFAITQFPIYYQKQNGVAGGNQSDDFLHFPNKENWQLKIVVSEIEYAVFFVGVYKSARPSAT